MSQQLFKLTIHAEGVLYDKDGNVISNEPITSETIISGEQAQAIAEQAALAQQEIADDSRPIGGEPS